MTATDRGAPGGLKVLTIASLLVALGFPAGVAAQDRGASTSEPARSTQSDGEATSLRAAWAVPSPSPPRAVIDPETPSRPEASRVRRVDTHSSDYWRPGPDVRRIAAGSGVFLISYMIPLVVGAADGNFSYAIPVVPVLIRGTEVWQSGPLGWFGAMVLYVDAAIQSWGIVTALVGAASRDPRAHSGAVAMRRRGRGAEWLLLPSASGGTFGLTLALVNW